MKILVCGGRDYANYEKVKAVISEIKPSCIIQGGAKGADLLAKKAAAELGLECIEYKADWKLGKKAGPLRNRKMLDENTDISLVLAFHEDIETSKGTKDMISYAQGKNYKTRIEK